MPPPIIAHITWAIISHARGVGEVQAVMGFWGRRKGRAPILRTNLGADFDFWLLGLDASPDYCSDHVREHLPCGGDRLKLWFTCNGRLGASQSP